MPAKASTTSKPIIRTSNNKGTKIVATIAVAYSGSPQSLANYLEDTLGDTYSGHGEYRIEVKKVSDAEFEKALA
jgi:hypothetical protein